MAIQERVFAISLLFISAIPLQQIHGQAISGGARKLALGSAVVALPGHTWTEDNPATPGPGSRRTISLFISRRFGLEELQVSALNVAHPLGRAVFALEGQSFGFNSYRERLFRAAIAYPLMFSTSRPFWTGISITFKHVSIQSYGSSGVYSLSFGLLFEIWPELYVATSALHSIQTSSPVSFSERFQTGLAYQFQDSSWLLLKISKTGIYPPSLHFGVEFLIQRSIQFRVGTSTQPYLVALGIGIDQDSFAIHLTAERHHLLGWTPALSIDSYI